jgi:hypothetical protein
MLFLTPSTTGDCYLWWTATNFVSEQNNYKLTDDPNKSWGRTALLAFAPLGAQEKVQLLFPSETCFLIARS